MPLNVRRFFTSVLLGLFSFIFINAQNAPTSADVMRERVAKAKAYIAVKNYNAAIYELESLRRETNDATVQSVTSVLLMNSYLEQGDYKRAQGFLTELFNSQKSNKPEAAANYFAVAGQVVRGARVQFERYRALGLSVSDRNLPLEASIDLEKMRETLELVVEQSKTISKEKTKTPTAMALLEEAGNARGNLARDDFDVNRWKDEIADARESLASSRSVIVNAVETTPAEKPVPQDAVAEKSTANLTNTALNQTEKSNNQPAALLPVSKETKPAPEKSNPDPAKPSDEAVAKNNEKPLEKEPAKEEAKKTEDKPKVPSENTLASNIPTRNRLVESSKQNDVPAKNSAGEEKIAEPQIETKQADTPKESSPVSVGSLIEYATQKVNPVYPTMARNMRLTGIVRVDVIIDEDGKVTEVQNTDGHTLLQRAAMDAIRRWKFKPFMRDGQPVKATGFVSFNFSL